MNSPYLELLKDRITLTTIPFTERGARLLLFQPEDAGTFQVRLAERWFETTGQSAGYTLRPLLIDDLQFGDAAGTPLDATVTTYPHRVDCDTSAGTIGITFAGDDTLIVTLPAGTLHISFEASMHAGDVDERGGVLHRDGDFARTLAYTTDATIVENRVTQHGEEIRRVALTVESDGDAALLVDYAYAEGDVVRTVPAAGAALDAAERRWHHWFDTVPAIREDAPWYEQYYYAWWIMRTGLLAPRGQLMREAMVPSKLYYIGAWQWDNYFHALAYRHVDSELAKDQIRVFLDHQCEDGMLPDAIHENEVVTRLPFPIDAAVTKPPLLGWAVWKIFAADGDTDFLEEVYAPLVRMHEWWLTQRVDDKTGLCAYHHPYSSGLDDNPLWDAGMPVVSPDLNTYLYLQSEALSHIAEVLGNEEDARRWSMQATQLLQSMFKALWDSDAGRFWALHDGERIDVHTPFNYYPLLTGKLPVQMSNPIVGHLADAGEFWARYPLATVALNDAAYDAETMWRGPVWINPNYLVHEGLQRAGYDELAGQLRRRTLELVTGQDDIYEYYNPETGQAPETAAPMFGWSAALFIDLAIQETRAGA